MSIVWRGSKLLSPKDKAFISQECFTPWPNQTSPSEIEIMNNIRIFNATLNLDNAFQVVLMDINMDLE